MNLSFQRFTVSSKVEHQSNFGAEVMTRHELADEWISTLIRPDARLARLRVDPMSNFVLAFQNLSLKQLTSAGNEVGFKPGEALGNLHSLFSNLIDSKLQPGSFGRFLSAAIGQRPRNYLSCCCCCSCSCCSSPFGSFPH